MKLQIDHLTKRYWLEREDREVLALSDVTFSVADGEFLAIVGPSGCGKTTMLNIVAGLLPYEEGSVAIDGKRVNGPGIDRAVVFQHASLLPWRTIAGNVRYGMEMQRRFDESERRVASERREVLFFDGARIVVGEAVEAHHLAAALEQGGRQVRSDEPGGAGDEGLHAKASRIRAGSRQGRPLVSTAA